MINHVSSAGGAERFAVGLATHLPQDRFEPWMCSTRDSDEVASQELAEAGVRHVSLGRKTNWDVYRFGGLVRLLRSQRFSILHTHMFGSNVWGSLLGTLSRTPVIVAHEHSWSYEGYAIRAWVDGNVIGKLATRFVAVSRADGERMVTREGVSAEKVAVIPNGYIPSPGTSDTDIRSELALDRDVPLIVIAAVLRPEKRIDVLLEAFAQVRTAVPHAHLMIAGDGDCRPALEMQARAMGLDHAVHFLGRRTDVDSVLRAADVGALSSDREGSPLLMFECMANGTPLVATCVGGVPDVIEHGRTGLLVPRRDPAALAQGLISLLTDPARRAAIATAAQERVRDYTIDVTAARFAALYDTLVPSEQ
jgi:glycosyltransferase involved in cell wall biosynthesis